MNEEIIHLENVNYEDISMLSDNTVDLSFCKGYHKIYEPSISDVKLAVN